MMEGISLAHQWSSLPLVLQSDCEVALKAIEDKTKNHTIFDHLIEEVKRLMNLREVVLVKIACDQNRVAHCLANFGRNRGSTSCWVCHVPECASQLVLADCNPLIEE